MGYNVKGATDLERLRPPDSYEQELIVAAEVRAYFQVAYKVSTASSLCLHRIHAYWHLTVESH